MRYDAMVCTVAALVVFTASLALAEKRGVRVDGKAPAEYVAEQSGKAYAVVIGIDRYQQKVGSLRYAVADAKAVAQTLKQRGYEVTELYNERATKRAIEHELRMKLPEKVSEQDRVLIFYAGHGQDYKVRGGKALGYLLPADGEKDDIPATGVSMGTVRELADALPAKHVLFLLDVCFGGIAGTLTRGSPPAVTEAYLKQITRERGRHLITAGAADQEVIESAQWGHSVFTYFLLKGLNEQLADQDDNGVITAQELFTYLESRVFGEAQQQGHTQTPQMAELSGEKGQFVFFTKTKGPTAGMPRADVSATPPLKEPTIASYDDLDAVARLADLREQAWGKVQTFAGKTGVPKDKRLAALDRFLTDFPTDNPHVGEAEALKQQITAEIQVAKAPAYEAPRQTGREITGKDGAPMALVPEGEFQYGSNNQRLSLSAFYMDKYEVSTLQYAKFMGETSRKEPAYWQTSVPVSNGQKPVVGVTWDDAEAYCRHYGKRLPTEQEWEKAARGTDGRKYPWGNEAPTSRHANFNRCCDFQNYGVLVNVGSLEDGKSPYGIYDLAGNVLEWTSSDYDSGSKVVRGGSWTDPALEWEASDRYRGRGPGGAQGFRCVQDAR